MRNNSIHKRLSWNYGSQANGSQASSSLAAPTSHNTKLHRSPLTGSATNSDSMLSFSSSGVSSTGSLHLSAASEVDDELAAAAAAAAAVPPVKHQHLVHVSSTYIAAEPTTASNVQLRLYQVRFPSLVHVLALKTRKIEPSTVDCLTIARPFASSAPPSL